MKARPAAARFPARSAASASFSLTIDKDAVDPEEVEMLQDMILSPPSTTRSRRVRETRESEMSKIGGAGMGGCFNHGRAD